MPSVMIATMTDPGLSSSPSAAISEAVSVMSLPIESSSAVLLRRFSSSGHHGELCRRAAGGAWRHFFHVHGVIEDPVVSGLEVEWCHDRGGGTGSLIAWPDR